MTEYPWTKPTVAAPFPAMEHYGANPPRVSLTVTDDDSDRLVGSASRLDHRRYLTIKEAAAELGIRSMTMGRWIRRGQVATFFDPFDRRVRLVLRADIERVLNCEYLDELSAGSA